jgi:hypothetical protein
MRNTPHTPTRRRRRRRIAEPVVIAPVLDELLQSMRQAQPMHCVLGSDCFNANGGVGKWFTPKGSDKTCSRACSEKLHKLQKAKSERKNRHKHRAKKAATMRACRARKKIATPTPTIWIPGAAPGSPHKFKYRGTRALCCSSECLRKYRNAQQQARRKANPEQRKPWDRAGYYADLKKTREYKRGWAQKKLAIPANRVKANAAAVTRRHTKNPAAKHRPKGRRLTPEHRAKISIGNMRG